MKLSVSLSAILVLLPTLVAAAVSPLDAGHGGLYMPRHRARHFGRQRQGGFGNGGFNRGGNNQNKQNNQGGNNNNGNNGAASSSSAAVTTSASAATTSAAATTSSAAAATTSSAAAATASASASVAANNNGRGRNRGGNNGNNNNNNGNNNNGNNNNGNNNNGNNNNGNATTSVAQTASSTSSAAAATTAATNGNNNGNNNNGNNNNGNNNNGNNNNGNNNNGNNNNGNNNNGNNNNGDPNTSLTLSANLVATNLALDGQATPIDGQVASLTSRNNFINFCAGKTITNGQQITGGSCNPIPMGDIIPQANMPSCKFQFPENFGTIPANQPFTVRMRLNNLQAGTFTNAQKTYYMAPQFLNGNTLIGHTHVVIQQMGAFDDPAILDPKTFAFFKGVNTGQVNGVVTADVTAGLPAGNYRMASINTSANHTPAIAAVAQHGWLDDITYFTVQ